MSAGYPTLSILPQTLVLPKEASLEDFIIHCQERPLVKNIDVTVHSDSTTKEDKDLKILSFYRTCRGRTRSGCSIIEQLGFKIGELTYPFSDEMFSRPCGISKITPIKDIVVYAADCSLYLAKILPSQSKILVPEWGIQIDLPLVTPKNKSRMPQLTAEPLICYM